MSISLSASFFHSIHIISRAWWTGESFWMGRNEEKQQSSGFFLRKNGSNLFWEFQSFLVAPVFWDMWTNLKYLEYIGFTFSYILVHTQKWKTKNHWKAFFLALIKQMQYNAVSTGHSTHKRKVLGTCSSIKSFIPSKNIIFGFSNTTAPSIQCTNSMVCVYVGTHTEMNRRFFIVFWWALNLSYSTVNRENKKEPSIQFVVCISYSSILGFNAVQSYLQ